MDNIGLSKFQEKRLLQRIGKGSSRKLILEAKGGGFLFYKRNMRPGEYSPGNTNSLSRGPSGRMGLYVKEKTPERGKSRFPVSEDA